jgi:hypothetical protein
MTSVFRFVNKRASYHLLSDGAQPIINVIYYLMALKLLQMSFLSDDTQKYCKYHLLSDDTQPITHVCRKSS